MGRIKENMRSKDIIIAMSDGNPGAITCIMQLTMYDSVTGAMDMALLDSLEIYGEHIYMLWNDCCKRDMGKLKETLQAFRDGKFTKKEIHENLSQVYAKPFI